MKIFYVTRDIERALGTEPSENYIIITNRTPYSESIQKNYPDFVHLISAADINVDNKDMAISQGLLDTVALLKSNIAKKLIDSPIMVFKNTALIEAVVKENGWTLLNPFSKLAEKIENKITQIAWLGELGNKYLPPHTVALTKDLVWKKEPLIIQWEHGHTGLGTILINSDAELTELKSKFPERTARATSFINGPSFTINVVVNKSEVLLGNISYQITGLPPFTDNVFSTIGNDWSLTHSILSEAEIEEIHNMAKEIGALMSRDGWKGLFGLDFIKDDERGRIFLIEINARQPASTTYESFLQEENRRNGLVGATIFEAHIAAISGKNIDSTPIIPINDGAQIIQRITKKIHTSANSLIDVPTDEISGTLELLGYRVIGYPNTAINEDLLRIQSQKGIMETHGKFNARGKEILEIL